MRLIDFVVSNLDKEWDFNALSKNPNITWSDVQRYQELLWNKYALTANPNMTWDIIIEHYIPANIKKYYISNFLEKSAVPYFHHSLETLIDLRSLSRCPNITWQIVQNNQWFPWNYSALSMNPNITWAHVKKNPDRPWSYSNLSSNPNITIDIIIKNLDKPWDFLQFSSNINVNMTIVRMYPNLPWSYKELSDNQNITWTDVKEAPDKPWDYNKLLRNPNIKRSDLCEFPKEYNMDFLSTLPYWLRTCIANENISKETTMNANLFNFKSRDYSYDYDYRIVSNHPSVSLKMIADNPDLPWNFDVVSRHLLNYDPWFQTRCYRENETKRCLGIYKDELIMRTCCPSRLFNWHEGAAEEYPEEYRAECAKWLSK